MESVTSNLRNNAAQLARQSTCPPCIVTSAAVCLALARVDPVDSLASVAGQIVAFLQSVTHFINAIILAVPIVSPKSDDTAKSSTRERKLAAPIVTRESDDTAASSTRERISAVPDFSSEADATAASSTRERISVVPVVSSEADATAASFTRERISAVPDFSSDADATTASSTRERISAVPNFFSNADAIAALSPWMIEFVSVMRHVVSLVSSNSSKTQSSALLMMFIARGGMPCVSELASALCQLSRNPRVDAASAGEILDVLASCCTCAAAALSSAAASASAPLHTLQFISDIWTHACDYSSKVQRPALIFIALAVSRHGPQTVSKLVLSETDVAAIVQVIVHHIESSQLQLAADDAADQASAAESACQVLCACLSVQPSLSSTAIPRNIFTHMCSFGWNWTRLSVSSSLVDSISSLVATPLQSVCAGLASHIFADLLHLDNTSPSLKLVVQLLEINASHVCDTFAADLSASKSDGASSPDVYCQLLLQYAAICSKTNMCDAACGFGMGLLFDDAWAALPASFCNLMAERFYLHAIFLSRQVISQATVSAAAFTDVLREALSPTDGGSAASLSLAALLCPCEEDPSESAGFRLPHLKLPEDFAEDFMWSLETSPSPTCNGRAFQISVLLRVGTVLSWTAPSEVEWRHRAASHYAVALAGDCPMQHLLLQTISEIVISRIDTLHPSLSIALVARTRHLRNDLTTPFGRCLLLQLGSCLQAGFVTPASLQPLLVNLLSVLNDETSGNALVTRTLVLALAAASSVAHSIVSEEIPNIVTMCHSAQRHVLRSLAAADARGVFDLETLQCLQLLCRLGASDVLVAEGMLEHLLRAFDSGIGIIPVTCITMCVWHAFAPQYAGEAWLRCRLIVSRILLHSNFANLLVQREIATTLADIIAHTIIVDYWACREVMPRVASILSSALQYQSVNLVRDFFVALQPRVPDLDASNWCEEFVVITSRCCACDDSVPDNAALRLAACRLICAVSQKSAASVTLSAVANNLVEALAPCSINSETMVLLIRTMLVAAAASPVLFTDRFPCALVKNIPLDVMGNLSVEAILCAVQRKCLWFLGMYYLNHALCSHDLSGFCIFWRLQTVR